MKEQYISVSEFARRAGVSRQAIQQRLDTSLQGFVKETQGKKVINIKGLELFEDASLAQGFVNLAQGSKSENGGVDQGVIDVLQKTIDLLQGQLDIKDQQLREKDKQIELLHKIIDQEQQLHAATTKQSLLPDQPATAPVEVVTVAEAAPSPIRDAAPSAAAPEQDQAKKRSFWDWLFD